MKNACSNAQEIKFATEVKNLKIPAENAHKNDFGHAVIIGSNIGMLGSSILSAKAAFRTGVGLVTVLTHPEHANLIPISINESMSLGITKLATAKNVLEKSSVVVLGPGLGRDSWAKNIFFDAVKVGKPLVIDADGLNLLAENTVSFSNDVVITPHLGEAARLLNTTVDAVQKDKLKAALLLQEKYKCNVLLKSASSIVVDAKTQSVFIINSANFGMATAGMGDLLTGIIAGLYNHTSSMISAVKVGVCLHAEAGALAAKDGKRGMVASDLLVCVRKLLV